MEWILCLWIVAKRNKALHKEARGKLVTRCAVTIKNLKGLDASRLEPFLGTERLFAMGERSHGCTMKRARGPSRRPRTGANLNVGGWL